MSVKVMGHVWDLDLPANKKFVLLAYVDHAEHDGTSIYPSEDKVAYKTGYSRRQVQRITDELEAEGYLIPDGQGTNGTNKWRFDWTAGKKLEPFQSSKKGRQDVTPKTSKGDDKLTPLGGDILTPLGVTSCPENDVKMSPESSYEPSIEPSERERAALKLVEKPAPKDSTPSLFSNPRKLDAFMLQNMGEPDAFKAYADVWEKCRKVRPIANTSDKRLALDVLPQYTLQQIGELTLHKLTVEKKGQYPFSWMVADLPAFFAQPVDSKPVSLLNEYGHAPGEPLASPEQLAESKAIMEALLEKFGGGK